jgi:hypothetical protein
VNDQATLETFSHLVEIDEIARRLKIYRLFSDGRRQLYTEADLPPHSSDSLAYAEFAKTLGENILLDSPAARSVLGL